MNFFHYLYKVITFRRLSYIPNQQNPYLLFQGLWNTMKVTITSCWISIGLGLGIGIFLYLSKIAKKRKTYFFINFGINIILSVPFLILSWLIINIFLGPYLSLYFGFKASVICLVVVLTAIFSRHCEQVFCQSNIELYETAITLGSNKIQFIRYFLIPETRVYLILKCNNLFISSLAYSSALAISGLEGLGQIAYDYGYQGIEGTAEFRIYLVLICAFLMFLLAQISYLTTNLIANRLNKISNN